MSIAFFDVDDTLIRRQTLFDFMRYALPYLGRSINDLDRIISEIRAHRRLGVSRELTNKYFYQILKGINTKELEILGQKWWDSIHLDSKIYVSSAYEALKKNNENGYKIVLVSGSFQQCLMPLAQEINADALFCTTLVEKNGYFTGKVIISMVGQAKLNAAEKYVKILGTTLSTCRAYGDHISDLPLLDAVGYPVVVGNNSEMKKIATKNGWEHLLYDEET